MPFLYTTKAIIDIYDRTLTLRVGKESCKFNIYQGMKHSFKSDLCFIVDVLDECVIEVQEGHWQIMMNWSILRSVYRSNPHKMKNTLNTKTLFLKPNYQTLDLHYHQS